MVLFEVGGGGDEVDAAGVEQVCGSVRPRGWLIRAAWHARTVWGGCGGSKGCLLSLGVAKAVLKHRTPGTLARALERHAQNHDEFLMRERNGIRLHAAGGGGFAGDFFEVAFLDAPLAELGNVEASGETV